MFNVLNHFHLVTVSVRIMTRGRKRDTTIPPSRELALQRAYRDRRAAHVAEIEARIRTVEEENKQLKAEVEQLRSALKKLADERARACGEVVAQATADLQQKLRDVSDSLASYQKLMLGQHAGSHTIATSTNSTHVSSEKHCGSEDCETDPMGCIARLINTTQQRQKGQEQMASLISSTGSGPVHQDPAESECCGGLLDCTGLVFDDMDMTSSSTSVPTSNVRSEN